MQIILHICVHVWSVSIHLMFKHSVKHGNMCQLPNPRLKLVSLFFFLIFLILYLLIII